MSNLGLERFLEAQGLDLVRTPVGDRYVLEQMLNGGYNLGGEQSGHIILSDYATTGDGFVAGAAGAGRGAEAAPAGVGSLPPLRSAAADPEERPSTRAASRSTIPTSKSAISDGEKRLNGHGRLLIRSSGTEPVIRVMGEGEDRILVEDVVDTIVSALGQAAA